MCTAPGIAPPRLARTVVPQYSPSLRVSRMTASGLAERVADVAPRRERAVLARAGPLALRRRAGVARDRQAARASRRRSRRRARARAGGRSTRGTRTRARRACPTARRRPRPASRRRRRGCKQVLDHPHEGVQRRRIGVDQAKPQRSRWTRRACARPRTPRPDAGRAAAAAHGSRLDRRRQLARRDQQLRVRVPLHLANRNTWLAVRGSLFDAASILGATKPVTSNPEPPAANCNQFDSTDFVVQSYNESSWSYHKRSPKLPRFALRPRKPTSTAAIGRCRWLHPGSSAWSPPGCNRRDCQGDPMLGFVVYWVTVAVCAGFVGISEGIVYNYIVHDEALARRRTAMQSNPPQRVCCSAHTLRPDLIQ